MHDFDLGRLGQTALQMSIMLRSAEKHCILHAAQHALPLRGAQAHQNTSDNKVGPTKSRFFFSCWSLALPVGPLR
jgi:hypothetical protein